MNEDPSNHANTLNNCKRQTETISSSSNSEFQTLDATLPIHENCTQLSPENEKEDAINIEKPIKFKPPKHKKPKPTVPDSIDETISKLQTAVNHFSNNNITPIIDFKIMAKFLHCSFGKSNLQAIASDLSLSTNSIAEMLRSIFNLVPEKILRHRISPILSKLENPDGYISTADSSIDEDPSIAQYILGTQ